jgi:antitoxin component of RelBE/YafQ-DinJ toxin-antitoxin module
MYDLNDIELVRVNVHLERGVKEWFQYRAKSMGMNMSQLMAFILTNYADTQRNNEAVRNLSDLAADEQTTVTNQEFIEAMQKLVELGKNVQASSDDIENT